jgi:hypothetical protein
MYAYDFYHLASYHRLDQSGKPLLLYFANGTESLAFPVILRNIEGTEYKDIGSVYGYAGPLSQKENPSASNIRLFHNELKFFFDSNQIVSAFTRLHPIMENQSSFLADLGEVETLNTTVGIDLELPEIDQKKQYSRSLKYRINYLKRKGASVVKASNKEEIDIFIEIYKENMNRVNATHLYYFSPDYFYSILKNIDSCILLAIYDGEFVSGSLCTFCNGIMQAHLNATRDKFLHLSPLKLVLDQARIEGKKENMKWLHLGGGRSGADDSLFVFKSRFSNNYFKFKVWKYIHNQAVYDMFIDGKYQKGTSSFFPLYRNRE